MNEEELEQMRQEAAWFDYVADQFGTLVAFLHTAIHNIQNIDNFDDELGDFNPSDDAILNAAVEMCKIVFTNNGLTYEP